MEGIKSYLLIGASSEIGLCFMKRLEEKAEKGLAPNKIRIVAHYGNNGDALKELAKSSSHLEFTFLSCDLRQEKQVESMLFQIREQGIPECLIWLAAGKMRYEKLKKLDIIKMEEDWQIQVRALACVLKIVLPDMAKNKFGKTVIMLSECTLGMPPKYLSEYVTVKYGALGLMKAAALEYADKNINVNGISPAMMDTKFLSEIDERFIEMNIQSSVKKRITEIDETVLAVEFLISKGSNYMNGVNLNLSGGNQG